MELTATELRKQLFTALQAAVRGERVALTYKGVALRIVRDTPTSKLNRLKRRPLIVHGDDPTDPKLLAEMEADWERDWAEL